MAAMTRYHVHARPWSHGWELHVDGVGVTQVDDLACAEQQIRHFVATVLEGQERSEAERISTEAIIDLEVHHLNA